MGKDGYEDAVLQDPNDPAQQHAANFTKNFDKIAEGVPVVHELRECAKAMVMATWLVDRNNLNQNECSTNKITNKFIQKMVNRFRTNDKLLKGFEPKSIVSEINAIRKSNPKRTSLNGTEYKVSTHALKEYPDKIPTLRKTVKT